MIENQEASEELDHNPYAPPLNESTKDLTRDRANGSPSKFPFWSIGPLTWISAIFVSALVFEILARLHGLEALEFAILVVVGVIVSTVGALVFGSIYAFLLWIVCRVFGLKPNARIHFWAVQIAVFVATVYVFESNLASRVIMDVRILAIVGTVVGFGTVILTGRRGSLNR